VRENIQTTSKTPTISDGITVTGEAMRRVSPEGAEFLVEITSSAPSAAQALRDNHARTQQIAHALGSYSIQPADLQCVSLNVYSLYSPLLVPPPPLLPQLAGQHASLGFVSPPSLSAQQEPQHNAYELQFGAYQARNVVRVSVRDAAKAGEVVDAAAKAGATILGGFTMRVDETAARKSVLESAAKDARGKAEALAIAAGKPLGEPIAITEEFVVSNGTYMALRAAMPFAFGAGTPPTAGEFEYYARVSARFNFQ
jgi:hypothetical protein